MSQKRVFTLTQRYRIETELTNSELLIAGTEFLRADGCEDIYDLDTIADVLEQAVELHHVGDSMEGIDVQMHSSLTEERDPGFF